jgi:hypothetical protein
MNNPGVEVIAVSNVYSRMMYFKNAGDVEIGHAHTYDHGTLVSYGSVLYEVLDGPNGNVVASKEFVAPGFVFVEKDKYHRITALADGTVCACIHALRTIDEDLVPPDCLIAPIRREWHNQIFDAVMQKTGSAVGDIVHPMPIREQVHDPVQ